MPHKMKSLDEGDDEEEDADDTLRGAPTEGTDWQDPLYQQAYAEVMGERYRRVLEETAKEPHPISGNTTPYRPELARRRRFCSVVSIVLVTVSATSYLLSYFTVAACTGALAIFASLGLGAFLLGEVLFGSGRDKQSEYLGTDGPFRVYSFKPFIDSPVQLFALVGNVVASIVLGYAEVYASLAALSWVVFSSKDLDFVSSTYFSLVTFATVGYGDFYPKSQLAKLLVCSEIVIALFVIAVLLATSTSWVLSLREELASERKTRIAMRMQRVEAAMKTEGIGLYQDNEQLHKDIQARIVEIKRAQPSK